MREKNPQENRKREGNQEINKVREYRSREENEPKKYKGKEDNEPKKYKGKEDNEPKKYKGKEDNEPKKYKGKKENEPKENSDREEEEPNENIIEGRNPVIEALKSGRTVEKLYVAKGTVEGSLKVIISMAKDNGIVISEVDRKKLDDMSTTHSHQGVIALVSSFVYSTIDEILKFAEDRGEEPFIVILDEIEDPHNLGSIIRSTNVCGAHGIIIPKRRSALVTATVAKASAGAVEYTKIAKITNLNQTIKELKEKGLWIIGTDMDGEVCYNSNLRGPIAIVIGSEGKGISRLVKENCDGVVSIPTKGEINSLNASVAAGIIMYEIVRQRGSGK